MSLDIPAYLAVPNLEQNEKVQIKLSEPGIISKELQSAEERGLFVRNRIDPQYPKYLWIGYTPWVSRNVVK